MELNFSMHICRAGGNCISVLSDTTEYDARLEILTVVTMKITVFWDMMPHSLVETYCFLGGKFLQNVGHIVTTQETVTLKVQGGSNMTGTDLCVNKPHCAAAVQP